MSEEKRPAEREAADSEAQAPETAAQAETLAAQNAALEQALQEKEQELGNREKEAREYLEGWQRERANFENFRKRMTRELDDAGIIAKVNLIRGILPAIDNLERALGDTTTDAEVVRKGVRMTYEQLLGILGQQGLKPVPSVGEKFDPNLHDAIDAVPDTGQEPDTVVEDLQKGYILDERLVRPARVRVAR